MIRRIQVDWDVEGNPTISMTQSYFAWRELCRLRNVQMEATASRMEVCTLCHGDGIVQSDEYGWMNCICVVMDRLREKKAALAPYRGMVRKNTFNGFRPWGSQESRKLLAEIKKHLKAWTIWPDRWVTLIGEVGTGKSHLLEAAANEIGPMALYISAFDLEAHIYKAVRSDYLGQLILTMETAPVLLYDDMGSEHGSEFVNDTVQAIFMSRYQRPLEYPTVVATNLDEESVRNIQPRMADRILDRSIADVFPLKGIVSWRANGPTETR